MKSSIVWAYLPFYRGRYSAVDAPSVSLGDAGRGRRYYRYNDDRYGEGTVDYETNSEFCRLLNEGEAKYIVLLEPNNEFPDIPELAATFKNGIFKRAKGEFHDKKRMMQIHIYPLISHDWFKAAFFDQNLRRDSDRLSNPVVVVDGKVMDFFPVCLSCPNRMRLVVNECATFHPGCDNPKSLFFGLSERPGLEWFKAHETDVSTLSLESFRTQKQLLLVEPFEPVSFRNVTHDLEKVEELLEQRSNNSCVAAATRRFRKVVCPGCMQNYKESWCSRRGGCSVGPFMDDDFQTEVDAAQPWQLHVLCETKRKFVPNDFVPQWSNVQTLAKLVNPVDNSGYGKSGLPEEQDGRHVRIVRELSRGVLETTIPYLTVCRALQLKPVESMQDAQDRFNDGKPFSRHVLAAARLICKHNMSSLWTSGGWSGSHKTFSNIVYRKIPQTLSLEFGRSSYPVRRYVENMADLTNLPGVRFEHLTLDSQRASENAFIRDVCEKTKIDLPPLALRQFYQYHQLGQYDRVIPVKPGTQVYEALKEAWRKYKKAVRTLSPTSPTGLSSKSGQNGFVPAIEDWLCAMAVLTLDFSTGTVLPCAASGTSPKITTAISSVPSTQTTASDV